MERLTEECHGLRGDLQRKETLVSQKEGVIAELRDEASTLWASRWLTFHRNSTKVFPGLDFNFQVPVEGEAKESVFDNEADPMVFSDVPNSVPLPSEPEIETSAEVSSSTSVTSTSTFDVHASQSLDSDV